MPLNAYEFMEILIHFFLFPLYIMMSIHSLCVWVWRGRETPPHSTEMLPRYPVHAGWDIIKCGHVLDRKNIFY